MADPRLPGPSPAMRLLTADTTTKDAARRIVDKHHLHVAAIGLDAVGSYFAVSLDDGTGGDDLYPSREEAWRFHDPMRHLFVQIQLGSMTPLEAFILLDFARKVAASGRRMPPNSATKADRRYIGN